MLIKIKNTELNAIILFLNKVAAKGKEARAISKFKKLLLEKNEEFSGDEVELLKEYCVLQEDGNLQVDENGKVTFLEEKAECGRQAHVELQEEEVAINLTAYTLFDVLITALENTDLELSGTDADVYDLLLDKLEEIKEEEK